MAMSTETEDLNLALSEQCRVLMAVKTLDSDLDLAYHLQMQEAMDASIALQPSSSRCSSQQPQPDDIVSSPEDNVLDVAATLMLQDAERFVQELEDRERSEAEMRKMLEDLDRRIHDQKFAAYILNIPEEEWKVHGDNYNSPYRSDASSSSSSSSSSTVLVDAECFRLYSKGLVSEESVRDMKVTVAGAGVAICDPTDNLMLEVRKNLESFVDGQVVTNEVAELEALIEGLNKAFSLNLKRLTFFCDHYMLYQYVTGRVAPQQSKVATLVNQVAGLQRKFTYCNPSLVARNDIKFAFKSARDAIISQITWPEETSNGKTLKETCVICCEDIDVDKMFSVDGCLHRYCFACMKQHAEVKLLNGMVVKCPHEGCKSEVSIDSCGKFLAPKLVEVLSQRMKESSIPITEKVYCPRPKCSALMSKSEVLQHTKTTHVAAAEYGFRKCLKCHYFFCINCKAPWHFNMTCDDYKRSTPYSHSEDAKLKSLAESKHWSQCVKCNNLVELAEGCYHITCRCGYEFCYTCGAEWKKKKATCSCPIWDERNIIRR
ncbi:E3 ubiquitin-protein ligase RSL1-like [Corylus avellana]|uniref:E3 ubiquitin-protein ligase RSL1-like n=1 Tax=Corylus avellana TaxID=13451 RepID=UPI001E23385E|nr:E3 ubiquitin-protein ligase RSL1-like [Corylus avellana]